MNGIDREDMFRIVAIVGGILVAPIGFVGAVLFGSGICAAVFGFSMFMLVVGLHDC